MRAKASQVRTGKFTVLFVCTGNICRSPLGERLLAAAVQRAGLTDVIGVSSAGVQAMTGKPMTEQAGAICVELGGDPSAHRARDLTEKHIEDADLIIAMAREHRSAIVRMVPRAVSRSFTLIEFSRLFAVVAAHVPEPVAVAHEEVPAFLRRVVIETAGSRGLAEVLVDPGMDDVVDPYRRSQETYDLSASQITTAGNSIRASLASIVGSYIGPGVRGEGLAND
jgi:protein-tyrosine phosphatase